MGDIAPADGISRGEYLQKALTIGRALTSGPRAKGAEGESGVQVL